MPPINVPTYARSRHQGKEPRKLYTTNLTNGILVIPAGSEMYVRTTGNRREKKAVALPYFLKNASALSASCWEINT